MSDTRKLDRFERPVSQVVDQRGLDCSVTPLPNDDDNDTGHGVPCPF